MKIHERRCGNCKFFHKLEYGFEIGEGFKESSCCIALTRMYENPDSYDSTVVETTENEMCEMWTEAREDADSN